MNNQEAILVLESINAKTDYFLINDDARAEAINMAISALQAQDVPDTNVGDTVSRQKVIDALSVGKELLSRVLDEINVVGTGREKYSWGLGLIEAYIKDIEELPSAQLEIIRCKDCKWWSNDDYRECLSPNYDDGYVTPAGFYCGYAERRTDERTD